MRTARSRVGYLTLAAIACGALMGDRAEAAAMSSIIDYSTTGTIDNRNTAGAPVITFQGIDHGVIATPTPYSHGDSFFPIPTGGGSILPLGQFVLGQEPNGATSTYNGSIMNLTVTVNSIGGVVPDGGPVSFKVIGDLFGTVDTTGGTSVKAAFNGNSAVSEDNSPAFFTSGFSAPGARYGLALTASETALFNNRNSGGNQITASGVLIDTTQTITPEPSTILLFALGSAALIVRSRERAGQ